MTNLDLSERFSNNLDNQKVFDIGVYHLGTLERQVVKDTPDHPDAHRPCVYRTSDGRACVVGFFIQDHELSPKLKLGLVDTAMQSLLPERLKPFIPILKLLQVVHDNSTNWRSNRRAMKEGLSRISSQQSLLPRMIDDPEMQWNKEVVS